MNSEKLEKTGTFFQRRAEMILALGVMGLMITLISPVPPAFLDLLLALVLTWLWRRRPQPAGTVFWCYVLLYSIGRGSIEFWRGDVERGVYADGLLSTSQLIAIGGILLASVMLVLGRVRRGAASA